ncbi:hypothetical protein CMUS01_12900 [Colletotrichum musicola]|uniref:Thioredoxin domain-containing protein n=1 Tax=Colletotrichum musicola TaxID=2175873 RepID=A0A8H6MYR3_9PEZI|nr:hypothetical protein CMUS01_12900 [Colletotrichum musicola]
MSLMQELTSWLTPTNLDLSDPPKTGDVAPSTSTLRLPRSDGRPVVIVFLRHCGCPFAEKSFTTLRDAAATHPGIAFIAVSHSSESHTQKWLSEIGGPGDKNPVEVLVDEERAVYARWGLGASGWGHVLAPGELAQVFRLAWEGTRNRPTESGSRWQTSGAWAVDEEGRVTWGGVAGGASEIPDVEAAVKSFGA